MRADWLDRIARAAAGRSGSPTLPELVDPAPAFTRGTGLRATVGLAAALVVGEARSSPALAQEPCVPELACRRHFDSVLGRESRRCANLVANLPPPPSGWIPVAIGGYVGCATHAVLEWGFGQALCKRATADGPFCRTPPPPPSALPPLPRPPVRDFPPIPTDNAPGLPRRKPPRRKPPKRKPPTNPPPAPPRRPGTCGNGDLPAGAVCCASRTGPVPCYTGCAPNGDGCCPSLSC